MRWFKIDDPVDCIAIHGFSGVWGMLCVGFFAEKDDLEGLSKYYGLFKGGGGKLLGIQALAIVCILAWTIPTNLIEVGF